MASLEAVQADVAMIKEAMTAQKPKNAGKSRNPARPLSAYESVQGRAKPKDATIVLFAVQASILRGAASKRSQNRETGGSCI